MQGETSRYLRGTSGCAGGRWPLSGAECFVRDLPSLGRAAPRQGPFHPRQLGSFCG